MQTLRHAPLVTVLAASGILAAACGTSTESTAGPTEVVATTDAGDDALQTADSGVPAAPPTDAAPEATDAPDVPSTDAPSTDVPSTEAPAPDVVATDVPATDAPPESTVPATTAPTAAEGVAVVYGGSRSSIPWAPLGWWDGNDWVAAGFADDGSFIVPPAPTYASLSATSVDLPDGPGAVIDGLSLGANDFYCVGDEMGPFIDIGIELPNTDVTLGFDAIAVTGDWPLQPRPVTQVGLENPEYAEIGAELFSDVATAGEGEVVQAIRADLDGDGIEEVLVTYERITDPAFGAQDDFTGVYARYPAADGTVVDELVVGYVMEAPIDFPTVGRYTVAAVGDLNGDGVMEVAIRDSFWESAGIAVFALDNGRLVQEFGGGCGV